MLKKITIVFGITAVLLLTAILLITGGVFTRQKKSNTLEIFSWWTAGGEAEGLHELFKIFNENHPRVKIINATVTGGAGYNARNVLDTRMKGGNPPDSFQIHAGPGLIEMFAEPGLLEPLSELYQENGWQEVFPEAILEKITYEGKIYAVPVNIHRSNLIWFNKSLFDRYEIHPPETWKEFFEVIEQLAESGVTPLALGDKNIWPAQHLLESIFLSNLGPERYRGLWTGETAWDIPEVRLSCEQFLVLLSYSNSDHAALTWDEAVQYVIDGKCAMICIGDFAEGYFKVNRLEAGEDFGWFAYPGTKGVFAMISDTFVLPKGAKNRENALEWLSLLGSRKGQDVFNMKKGSIPARLDLDISHYDLYLLSARNDFLSSKIVGSITHGAAASQNWQNDLTEITKSLIIGQNIDNTISSFEETADKYTGFH